jgi:hypothetical protein
MDQKTIVLDLGMKGMSLDAIHEDLVRTLGTDAVTYPTVTKYARSAKFSPKKDQPSSNPRSSSRALSMTLSWRLLLIIRFRRYASSPDGPAFLHPLCTST